MLHCGECDRQVLDGESGGIEDGRLVVAAPPVGVAGENRAELGDAVVGEPTGLDGVDEVAVVARLLGGPYKQNTLLAHDD